MEAAVAELLADVEGTVGVISASARRSEVAQWLGSPPFQESATRLQVVDGMQAKGMEYDAVVVVAPEEMAAESAAGCAGALRGADPGDPSPDHIGRRGFLADRCH